MSDEPNPPTPLTCDRCGAEFDRDAAVAYLQDRRVVHGRADDCVAVLRAQIAALEADNAWLSGGWLEDLEGGSVRKIVIELRDGKSITLGANRKSRVDITPKVVLPQIDDGGRSKLPLLETRWELTASDLMSAQIDLPFLEEGEQEAGTSAGTPWVEEDAER